MHDTARRHLSIPGKPRASGTLAMASARRALEAKFYVGEEGESMRAEWRLWIAAGAARSRLAPSASVGKRSNSTGPRVSAYGYKRSASTSRTPSASPPAPDFRVPVSPIMRFSRRMGQCPVLADSVRSTLRSRRSERHR